MTRTLFVSDLHLCEERPQLTRLFLGFLAGEARLADKLFILGDLFEYWAGDDDLETLPHRPVVNAMKSLVESGVPVFIMHGNRDFLIGDAFLEESGATLLPDPTAIDLHGRTALLSHGDLLCTDDQDYQQFREIVRDPGWKQEFLSKPLSERKTLIASLRSRSEQEKAGKKDAIMDVSPLAVEALLRQNGLPSLLIHGHTHRPGRHIVRIGGAICERIVLADWRETGSFLSCSPEGCESSEIP